MITHRKIYKYYINCYDYKMNKRKFGGLVSLLGGIGLSLIPVNTGYSEEPKRQEPPVEWYTQEQVNSDSALKIATFEYDSNRPGYEGQTFEYDIMTDGSRLWISQTDEEDVNILLRGFYDINDNKEFDEAELKQIESDNFIYMHPEFNEIVNSILGNKLEEQIRGQERQREGQERPHYHMPQTRKDKDKTVPESQKEQDLHVPEVPQPETPLEAPQNQYASERETQSEEGSNQSDLALILGWRGPGFEGDDGMYGGEAGIKYGRFALVGNVSGRADRNVKDINENLTNGIYFKGKEDLTNFLSLGGTLEYHQPIITPWLDGVLGAGLNLESYTRKGEAKIIRENGEVINSNTGSTSERDLSGELYLGPSIKFTDWLNFNFNMGGAYNFNKGDWENFANAHLIFQLPNIYKDNR